jgi:hypothetical protein
VILLEVKYVIAIHEWFSHKLNHFPFAEFLKKKIICAKKLITIFKLLVFKFFTIEFKLQTFKFKSLRLKQSKHKDFHINITRMCLLFFITITC